MDLAAEKAEESKVLVIKIYCFQLWEVLANKNKVTHTRLQGKFHFKKREKGKKLFSCEWKVGQGTGLPAYVLFLFLKIFIYLAVPGLSGGM